MKTFIIVFAILILAGHFLIASALEPMYSTNQPVTPVMLAPVIPMEASFADPAPNCDYSTLAPVVPAEATFNDEPVAPDLSGFAPFLPKVADFD